MGLINNVNTYASSWETGREARVDPPSSQEAGVQLPLGCLVPLGPPHPPSTPPFPPHPHHKEIVFRILGARRNAGLGPLLRQTPLLSLRVHIKDAYHENQQEIPCDRGQGPWETVFN